MNPTRLKAEVVAQADQLRSAHCREARHVRCQQAQGGTAWVQMLVCRCPCHAAAHAEVAS